MKQLIAGILDIDSPFGRTMTKCWVMIGSNFMFVLFSIPFITMGPALAGLYHVALRSLRTDGDISPTKEFRKGFPTNFKQGILVWIAVILLAALGIADLGFVLHSRGPISYFKYALYIVMAMLLIMVSFLYPVMAAFKGSLKELLRDAVYFIGRNPIRAILIAALNAGPIALTYLDGQRQPLYVFLWVFFGFAGIARIISKLLIGDFNRFLPDPDTDAAEVRSGEDEEPNIWLQ